METPPVTESTVLDNPGGRLLCLTILGYRKPGMTEEEYRHHMTKISAPMTQDLMVKYGMVRWTQIHNQRSTRALMSKIVDPQMVNIADFDCFSQVVFKSIEDYKSFKKDPYYKKHLFGDHVHFADTQRSQMTIGWIEQFIDEGKVVDGFPQTRGVKRQHSGNSTDESPESEEDRSPSPGSKRRKAKEE
ncbi:EthD domain-containing protein [Diaporthe eres]|uniref:EthD domain-containing protein n=1 Tax=Diaporthe vaccinii TaxID=105482 RepID=A0ABR4F124_9PEZI|nr:EthD domain-containing protein [Diaporthe eres]